MSGKIRLTLVGASSRFAEVGCLAQPFKGVESMKLKVSVGPLLLPRFFNSPTFASNAKIHHIPSFSNDEKITSPF
ncbi:MAG: hypothetical protein R2830_26725 [Saprospiraceae bacterium]